MKTYGRAEYSSTVLDVGSRWRLAVSFTPRPLYHQGKGPVNCCRGSWERLTDCLDAQNMGIAIIV
jgi:hypothetical protein